MGEQNTIKVRSIAQRLAFWIGGFFTVSAISLLGWTYYLKSQDSLTELKSLATTNAEFLEGLRLPYSPQLASQLSKILNLGVGFQSDNTNTEFWPEELRPVIQNLAKSKIPIVHRHGKWEVALAPLSGSSTGHFVLLRNSKIHETVSGNLWSSAVLPIVFFAVGCGALAFGLGKSVVAPLTQLTSWLPNLRDDRPDLKQELPVGILHRTDEVGRLARALNDLQTELAEEKAQRAQAERLAALGKIATNLAHEVKNPAAAIRMHADLLLDQQKTDSDASSSLSFIREEVDQISDLVNQWLFVSKASPSALRPADLRDLLGNVNRRMSGLLADRCISFRIGGDSGPFPIEVDAPRIEQVLRNVIQNAIDAMPEGGTIEVKLELTSTKVNLEIRDSGPGFSRNALAHFGEPFFSEREGGMGIGLTLACEVISAHAGTIIPSNFGNEKECSGAIVSLSLPRSNSAKT